jgi:hypothetical protein
MFGLPHNKVGQDAWVLQADMCFGSKIMGRCHLSGGLCWRRERERLCHNRYCGMAARSNCAVLETSNFSMTDER